MTEHSETTATPAPGDAGPPPGGAGETDRTQAPAPARAAAWLGHVLPPLVLFIALFFFYPYREAFSFDPDEGNNLIKARLLADGHAMYSEIWSDQPPLFAHALRGWLELTGWSVNQARLLVLLCSCLLLWSFYQLVRMTAGHLAAAVSAAALVLSFGYLQLSVSVMLAVPSLMLAVVSLHALARYRLAGGVPLLVASGACLALSVATKMWTGLLIPVAVGAILAGGPRRARALAWWGGGFAATLAFVFLLAVPPAEAWQLVTPHLHVHRPGGFDAHSRAFWGHFIEDMGIVAAAGVGAVVALGRRDRWGLVPLAWAALALAVLWRHAPLWYHHYLLVAIPMCWCAGLGASAVAGRDWLDALRTWRGAASVGAWCAGLTLFAAAGLVAWQVPRVVRQEFTLPPAAADSSDWRLVADMARLGDRTHWVVTDAQIVAFRAGLGVPPALAVTSLKRQWGGNLSEQQVMKVIDEFAPEQIYLSGRRIPVTGLLLGFLNLRYHPVPAGPGHGWYFVRKDLSSPGLISAAGDDR